MFTFPLNISHASTEKNNSWINRYTCSQFLITPAILAPFFPDKLKELSGLILYCLSFKSFVAMYRTNCSKAFLEFVPFWHLYYPFSHQSKQTSVIYVFLSVTTCCLVLFHHSVHLHNTAEEGRFQQKFWWLFHNTYFVKVSHMKTLNTTHFPHAMYTCYLQLITWFITHLNKIQSVG